MVVAFFWQRKETSFLHCRIDIVAADLSARASAANAALGAMPRLDEPRALKLGQQATNHDRVRRYRARDLARAVARVLMPGNYR